MARGGGPPRGRGRGRGTAGGAGPDRGDDVLQGRTERRGVRHGQRRRGDLDRSPPKVDGTGIEISFDDSIARRGAPAVPDSPYPIEVTEPVDASPAGGDDRYQTPYPPYAGGASIINGTGWVKICSTGWPVLIDNPAPLLQRKYGMMFASHCVTDTASSYWTTWPSEEYSGSRFFVGYTSLSTYRYGAGDAAIMVNDPPTVSGVSDPHQAVLPVRVRRWAGQRRSLHHHRHGRARHRGRTGA